MDHFVVCSQPMGDVGVRYEPLVNFDWIVFPSGLVLTGVAIFISEPQDEEIGVGDGQDFCQEGEPLEYSDSSDLDEKDFGL
jgi:hypothetical protein